MSLCDPYGYPVSSRKFANAASRDQRRGGQYVNENKSINDLIPSHDRRKLVALSKRLFTNMGAPMRAAIRQKARYSVGRAWLPTYGGSDQEVGAEVRGWLEKVFYPLADVRGGKHGWHSVLTQISTAMDRDGEAFLLLTSAKADETFPRVQHIPSYMVASDPKDETVESGGYAGLKLLDGIVYNEQMAPVAYRVQWSAEEDDFEDISARSMIHVYDDSYQEQGRGLPAFTHALEDLKSMLQSTEFERIRQEVISSILLVEKNDLGGPDLDDPAYALSSDSSTGGGVSVESISPHIKFFSAGSGNGLETVTHDSPGEVWESFHDRMIRSALAGMGWSYSLVWKAAGQGTAERTEVEKARRAVEERQAELKYAARRMLTYAVATAESGGRVPMPGNMLSWDFTMPARLTVDDGREAKSQTDAHRAGHTNETEIQGNKGRTVEAHYQERAEEAAKKELARLEAEKKYGVAIDPREMGLVTANEPAGAGEVEE